MNARWMLSGLFLAVIAVGGCSGSGDTTEAPPPRAKGANPKADMLVGKWKMVKQSPVLIAGLQRTYEFTQDGRVTVWIDNPQSLPTDQEGNPWVESGTYRVEGDTLIITIVGPERSADITLTIASVTKDTLTTTFQPPRAGSDGLQIADYERVPQKL